MSETGARKLAVMVITLILLAAGVSQADTDCSSKCARQCSYSLFPTTCLQGCFKKCKHSFSVALFGIGCTFGCTNSKCAHLGSGIWSLSLSLYIIMCVWINLKKHCEKLILFLGEHRLVFRKINHPYWIIWTPIYYANKSFSLYWQCGRCW